MHPGAWNNGAQSAAEAYSSDLCDRPEMVTDPRADPTADLHRWRAFLAIAEFGSLTRAALFLNSNQSLLSRQLNALERDCGGRLFSRTGRGLTLSDMGGRIHGQVKALLADADQLESEIRGEAREPAGRVGIGSLPSIAHPLVGRLFTRLRACHPSVRLRIHEGSSGQVEEWLADSRIHIAILYRYGTALPAGEQPLAVVDSYLVGAPGDRLTRQKEVPFDALDGLPFILPSVPNGLRNALDALARRQRITLEPAIEADSLPLMKSAVESERLYTVLPLHTVWDEVQQGRLQTARVIDPSLQRTVSMVTAQAKGPAKAVTVVAEQILKIVAEMADRGLWRTGGTA
jgi:LysR family nitrogen assimilation transcriptional regulator